jgi:phosphoesterase RecJ-like protein
VKTTTTISNIAEALLEASNIAILTHIQPDGDAIGSSLALMFILRRMGKNVKVFCQDPVPGSLKFLPNWEEISTPQTSNNKDYIAIALDVSDEGRLGSCFDILKNAKKSMQMDHHATNSFFADINLVDSSVAATGMLVFRLAKELGANIDKDIATYLYTAISGDTGNFCFPSVTDETFDQMAQLMRAGLDIAANAQQLHLLKSLGNIRMIGSALTSLKIKAGGRLSAMCLLKEDFLNNNAKLEEADGIVNLGLYIHGVEAAYLATETKDGIKFNLRCLKPYDVSSVAEQFGGGGHMLAAGCTIENSMDKALESMDTAMEAMLKA